MLVRDIWNDAKSSRGYGNCDPATLYSVISDAVRNLSNEVREWDFMVGRMKLCAEEGYLTLPREIEVPLGCTIDGVAAWPRDKWFIHHINGPGCNSQIDGFREFYDEVGQVCTFREIPCGDTYLLAVPEDAEDIGLELMLFGYDNNDRELQHTNDDGAVVQGRALEIKTDGIPPAYLVKKIDRIQKPVTKGAVLLWAYSSLLDDPLLVGFFYPDETEPRYRRMRFPKKSVVTMTYRRKTMDVHNQDDWIPFDNKMALLWALKYIKHANNDDLGRATASMQEAVNLMRKEEASRRVVGSTGPQIRNFSSRNQETLRGSAWGGCGRGRNC